MEKRLAKSKFPANLHAMPLTPNEAHNRILAIENDLSPENLHCDGEHPAAEAEALGRALRAERARLVEFLGYEPSENARQRQYEKGW